MAWSGWLSKSQIIQFLTCPYSWYLAKIKKVKQKYVEALENGKEVHKALENVYISKEQFESKYEILEELKKHKRFYAFKEQFENFSDLASQYTLKRPLFREYKIIDKNNKMRAIIDRIDRIENELYVVEYKWSSQWPWTHFELSLYASLLENKWHTPIRKGTVFYLTDNIIEMIEITNTMKNDAIKTTNNVRNEIYKKLKDDKFEKRTGVWCENCPYKEWCLRQ